MNNKLLRTYILLAFTTVFTFTLPAQTILQWGQEDPATLVKTPLIHWDCLRTLSPEWIREQRNTPTAPWQPLNRLFNEQDAGGRFTLLHYQVWSFGNNDWVDDNKNTYWYTLDANNRVVEMQVSEINQFYTNSSTIYF
ncbi:MAG TPA: hypothetical protein VEC12_09670, partial [Bacteroidia bacterium]|nr:hypothetical protein [Bacteroidia bacterium]